MVLWLFLLACIAALSLAVSYVAPWWAALLFGLWGVLVTYAVNNFD